MKNKRYGGLLIIVLICMLTASAVCATEVGDSDNAVSSDSLKTFTDLDKDINASDDSLDMQYDYTFNNQSDNGYREGLFHTKEIMLSMHFAVREFGLHQLSNCRSDIAF